MARFGLEVDLEQVQFTECEYSYANSSHLLGVLQTVLLFVLTLSQQEVSWGLYSRSGSLVISHFSKLPSLVRLFWTLVNSRE